MFSHVAYPTPVHISEQILRIFFATRDSSQRGAVGFIDVNPQDPTQILRVSEHTVIQPGEKGDFDQDGISPGNICKVEGGLRLYYLGWSLREGGSGT